MRVVTPKFAGPLPSHTGAELCHYPISRRTPLETFFTNALFSRIALETQLRRTPADVVVLNSYDVAYGYLTLARPQTPSIFVYHSSFHSTAVERLAAAGAVGRLAHRAARAFVEHVERVTFERSDAIVAVSSFSRSEIESRLGHVDSRIQIIPTGVDTHLFSPGDRAAARARAAISPSARVLLTVGRLVPVKRYDRAVRALAILATKDPLVELVIVGDGPELPVLRALASTLGVSARVRFAGFADGELLRDLYRAADLLLCTSEFENWSLTLLEALGCGTPAIGTPRGGTPDLLTEVDARLVTSDVSPEAIAECAGRWLADERGRRRAGVRGREVVIRRYGWDRTVNELEHLMLATTSRRPASGRHSLP